MRTIERILARAEALIKANEETGGAVAGTPANVTANVSVDQPTKKSKSMKVVRRHGKDEIKP